MDFGSILIGVTLSDIVNMILVDLEFCAGGNRLPVKWAHLHGLEVLHDTANAEGVLAWQLAGLGHQTQTY